MVGRGPQHLRNMTNTILDALIQSAESICHDRRIGLEVLHDIVNNLKDSPGFNDFYARSWRRVMEAVAADDLDHKRENAFGRLMVHPLGEAFHSGELDRAILPNVFQFFQLVLGDDNTTYGEHCREILADIRADVGEDFEWDAFYADARAVHIQWHALVRIAESFKRWDVRKEWFIKLMHYTPTTVSVGHNAFVVTGNGEAHNEPRVFTNREFGQFFLSLFAPLTNLSPDGEKMFSKEFGKDTHHRIGDFLVHLKSY